MLGFAPLGSLPLGGQPEINQTIAGALFTDPDTFYGATVSTSYSISGALFSNADTFFASTVTTSYGVAGNLYSNVNTFFGASIVGDQAIAGSLYANDNSFFRSTVTGGTARQTGGGGGFPLTEQHVRDLREAAQRQRDHQDRTQAQKRRDQIELRKALERAWEGIKDEDPAVFAEAAPEVDFAGTTVNWAPLVRDPDAILRIIADIEAKLAAQRLNMQADDDEAMALIFLAA